MSVVLERLNEIREIGRDPVRGGYSRHWFDPAEMAQRDWFVRSATNLGLASAFEAPGFFERESIAVHAGRSSCYRLRGRRPVIRG